MRLAGESERPPEPLTELDEIRCGRHTIYLDAREVILVSPAEARDPTGAPVVGRELCLVLIRGGAQIPIEGSARTIAQQIDAARRRRREGCG